LIEICLSEVDNCQIFVGLIGEKYGWIPTSKDVRDDVKIRYDWREGDSVTASEVSLLIY
jgi:telomerase protein component 1